MEVPSRLNEYPEGTTRPTTDFEQPSSSSFRISPGRAGSEEEVQHDQKLLFEIPQEFPQVDSVGACNQPENDKDEKRAGQADAPHQLRQGHECLQAEFSNGECH